MRKEVVIYSNFLLILFFSGLYIGSFGVLIPYYSNASKLDETQYSFTFLMRAIAFVLGTVSIKFILRCLTAQSIMVIYCAIIGLSLFICSLSISTLNLSTMIFLSSFCIISTHVIIFSQTINLFANNQPDFWVVFLGAGFGLGASLGPFFVMIFQLHTYQVFSLIAFLTVLLFLKYPLEDFKQKNENENEAKNLISQKTEMYICLIMLLFPAEEAGMSGWIPTYAIKAGIATFQSSGIYSALFWLSNGIFRLIWAFCIKTSVNNRLRFVLSSMSILSLLLFALQQMQYYTLLCVIGPIYFGAMLSCLYAFCLIFPTDNGFQNSINNSANFVMAYCIGEGIMPAPLGYFMGQLGFKSLMAFVLVTCLLSWWSLEQGIQSMKKDKINNLDNAKLLSIQPQLKS